ncbi:hypothetical protein [Thermodesulfovibrio sp. 3462-1]|uniref:Lipoprotein n=1 Tax=Thermodesulfovibrio obliviosus TaxID=3118332 RepID=A0AAU8GZZ3_9BACT
MKRFLIIVCLVVIVSGCSLPSFAYKPDPIFESPNLKIIRGGHCYAPDYFKFNKQKNYWECPTPGKLFRDYRRYGCTAAIKFDRDIVGLFRGLIFDRVPSGVGIPGAFCYFTDEFYEGQAVYDKQTGFLVVMPYVIKTPLCYVYGPTTQRGCFAVFYPAKNHMKLFLLRGNMKKIFDFLVDNFDSLYEVNKIMDERLKRFLKPKEKNEEKDSNVFKELYQKIKESHMSLFCADHQLKLNENLYSIDDPQFSQCLSTYFGGYTRVAGPKNIEEATVVMLLENINAIMKYKEDYLYEPGKSYILKHIAPDVIYLVHSINDQFDSNIPLWRKNLLQWLKDNIKMDLYGDNIYRDKPIDIDPVELIKKLRTLNPDTLFTPRKEGK